MKYKLIYLILCVFIFSNFIITAQMSVEVWEELYSELDSIRDKEDITRKIYENVTKEYEKLLIKMLDDQVLFVVNERDTQEKDFFESWVLYTAMSVEKTGIKNGQDRLQNLYKKVDNLRIKGLIAFTIGGITDKAQLPWLNKELESLNNKHRDGIFGENEILLYYIIKALEFYSDESSFIQMFYASIPNYSDKTRKLAGDILKKISSDPAPLCNVILEKETEQDIRLAAFEYAMNSESSNENKIETCRIALLLTIDAVTKTEMDNIQDKLRNDACLWAGKLKAKDKVIIDLIEKKWDFDNDTTAKLITIESLAEIGTEDAGKVISKKLKFFIDKKKAGDKTGFNEKEGKKIITALIHAIAKIPGDTGLSELYFISTTRHFGSPIKREAEKAIKEKK